MKKCPFCAEQIQDEAIKCRWCGERLVDQNQAQRAGELRRDNIYDHYPTSVYDSGPDGFDERCFICGAEASDHPWYPEYDTMADDSDVDHQQVEALAVIEQRRPLASPGEIRHFLERESVLDAEDVDAVVAEVAANIGGPVSAPRSVHRVVNGAALALGVVALIFFFAVSSRKPPPPPSSQEDEVYVDYEVESLRPLIERWNNEPHSMRTLISNYNRVFGEGRCWTGFMADFPDQAIVTIIWSGGPWVQFKLDGGDYPLANGDSYLRAGISTSQLDSTGNACSLSPEGQISL